MALPQNCKTLRKPGFFWGRGRQTENYFEINLLRILRLFLIAMAGRPLTECRLIFSSVYARAEVSEWTSSSILPEPLRKRDIGNNR